MLIFCVLLKYLYTVQVYIYKKVKLETVNWLFNILYRLLKFGNNLLIDQLFDERA